MCYHPNDARKSTFEKREEVIHPTEVWRQTVAPRDTTDSNLDKSRKIAQDALEPGRNLFSTRFFAASYLRDVTALMEERRKLQETIDGLKTQVSSLQSRTDRQSANLGRLEHENQHLKGANRIVLHGLRNIQREFAAFHMAEQSKASPYQQPVKSQDPVAASPEF